MKVSLFDELLEASQRVVPLFRDELEGVTSVFEPFRPHFPEALPAFASRAQQARIRHGVKVLGDGLPCDVEADGELGDRQRSFAAKTRDEPEPSLVSEGGEDRGCARLRAQDASRSA
jgi:hypothetical protein